MTPEKNDRGGVSPNRRNVRECWTCSTCGHRASVPNTCFCAKSVTRTYTQTDVDTGADTGHVVTISHGGTRFAMSIPDTYFTVERER